MRDRNELHRSLARAFQEIPMSPRKVDDHVEIEAEDARAGQTGNHLRYILIGGLVLVVVGFAAVAMGWFG